MSLINAHIGPTTDEVAELKSAAAALQSPALLRLVSELPIWEVTIPCANSVSAGATTHSAEYILPCDATIESVQVSADAAAGATGTVNVSHDEAEAGTFVSCLTGGTAVDVKTGAPSSVEATLDSTKVTLTKGTKVRCSGASGSGGALTGAKAFITFRRA